jgi:xylose isomerase
MRMQWNYAVITGFLGRLKDRFVDYQPARTIEEILRIARDIPRCSGVELVYPQDFGDPAALKRTVADCGLGVAAINLNVKSEELWRFGSFSNPDPAIRAKAVEYMKSAMDHAAELECDLVTSAFLNDGADYPFETDFIDAFARTVEGVREAAAHREDIRVALEYKASEPRAHCLLGNAGKAAYMAELIGRDNVGVNVDIGHAFQAQEIPADTIAFLGATGKLFYIHINDNYRNWDWDLVPGMVNYWDYLELALYLKRVDYRGWLTADVFPQRRDPSTVMAKTFEWMDAIVGAVNAMDDRELIERIRSGDVFETMEYVKKHIQ